MAPAQTGDVVRKESAVIVTDKIKKALRERYRPRPGRIRQWVYYEEIEIKSESRRLDGIAFNLYRSQEFKRISFEIKASRADFLKELKQPEKREAAMRYTHEFYFVVGPDVLFPSEVPENCGYMVLGDSGGIRIRKHAELRKAEPLPEDFIAKLACRMSEPRSVPFCPNCKSEKINWYDRKTSSGYCGKCKKYLIIIQGETREGKLYSIDCDVERMSSLMASDPVY